MLLKLINYDVNVTYKPGKSLYIADTLSRVFLKESDTKFEHEMALAVHSLMSYLPISDIKKSEFKSAAENDSELQLIIGFVHNDNWPDKNNCLPLFARQIYKMEEDLFIFYALLFVNNKLVVPTSLRVEMLKSYMKVVLA